jgi:ribonuclease HI
VSSIPPVGKAAPRKITLVFDGGSRGNPGHGYGSYAVYLPGSTRPTLTRLNLGEQMTNNEAEYDTLIAGLTALLANLEKAHEDPRDVTLEVRGDSQLLVRQVKGEWQAREARLIKRRNKVRLLLARFGSARIIHHPREKSVAILGH